ncbi:Pantoate--beta-alanine ligase [Planococcus halocryophilus Or1]|uniref:Pantothenate synthetase n=1 Tax=Planococcus halocryophilus TaxID=1215089 RepID=A0A1C7DQ24_9BACL|nr:pantoate--beta-alanine ligase [Planococcus halocryophilus]ANU13371.1 pantoate--beta-alanine ligase [Planococcus halocryophilus]EMF46180.1 Pantoate--beta-alanine ligase [Planococcus halocryophilus Or1]
MLILQTVNELKEWVRDTKKAGKTIGLVPTMGFLHEGHLSLVKKAKAENDKVVMSIFVNPAQFGPNEDFDRYPRDLKRDQELADVAGTDVIFAPSVEEMYPRESQIQLSAGAQADVLCGAKRPGHFDGVLKVVTKLFHLVEADLAYFGQKDAQQLAIIESLVADYNFPMAIRRGETVREDDGLAKSSRNVYLSDAERNEAPHLRKALEMGKELVLQGQDPIEPMTVYLTENTSGIIDYIELLDYPTLTTTIQQDAILALAVKFEKARLIDNIIFNQKGN